MNIKGTEFTHDGEYLEYQLKTIDPNFKWEDKNDHDMQNKAYEYAAACMDESSTQRTVHARFERFSDGRVYLKITLVGSTPATFVTGGVG